MGLTTNSGKVGKLPATDKRIADYAMVLDLLGSLTATTSEKVVIESIMDLFKRLCAPSAVIYVPVIDGLPVEASVFPVTLDPKAFVKEITCDLHDDYSLTVSGNGFILRISYGEILLGFIVVDGMLFPKYIDHYLNLSLSIIKVIALSINNARIYQSLQDEMDERKKMEEKIKLDIIEKNQMIDELKESEQRLKSLFDGIADAIFLADPETGYIIDANSAASELLNKPISDIIGLHYTEIHPKETEQYSRELFSKHTSILRQNIQLPPDEDYVIRSDGKHIPVELNSKIVYIKGKRIAQGVFRDITERKNAEKEMSVLLKEIHHRVKNNMQIISSLLSLQTEKISDTNLQNIFKDSQNRIKAMALIHEKLYQSSNLAVIDVAEYIQDLSSELFHSYNTYSDTVELKLDIDIGSFDIDLIVPCGLVLNELLSNALKSAFPSGRKGIIMISFNRNPDDKYLLVVSDDGIGISEEFDINKTESLGLQLVIDLITIKLNGTIDIDRTMGTKFTMIF
ncbi:MAG: PAS domain S-box protein [Nitrospirae bacterium]|nr:PAS domain S-box protein [Nitrospirota bacterium]MBF0553298.1 PAS domain S-box protein [Nitrospirota bacterium]